MKTSTLLWKAKIVLTKLLSAAIVFWTPAPQLREVVRRQILEAKLRAYEAQAEAIETRHRAAAAQELAEWWTSLGEELELTGENIPGHNNPITLSPRGAHGTPTQS